MTTSYNPNETTLVFAGYIIGDGLQSITVSRVEDPTSTLYSIDGRATVVHNNNRSYTCEIVLDATSPDNEILSSILAAMDGGSLNGGTGVGSFRLASLTSTDEIVTDTAYIQAVPDFGFAAEPGARTWTLHLVNPDVTYGAHPLV